MRHRNGPVCVSCEGKLGKAHPELIDWFHWAHGIHENLHISWSFRTEFEQNELVLKKATKLVWPNSKHNAVDEFGQPESKALDLFILRENPSGGSSAYFPNPKPPAGIEPDHFYEELHKASIEAGFDNIIWGGNFIHTKGDFDHYEIA